MPANPLLHHGRLAQLTLGLAIPHPAFRFGVFMRRPQMRRVRFAMTSVLWHRYRIALNPVCLLTIRIALFGFGASWRPRLPFLSLFAVRCISLLAFHRIAMSFQAFFLRTRICLGHKILQRA
ncbi:MAG TPA: hypothetical protein VN612_07285 [Acidobacteriaceae bacterium]|nr:hypothetical protein [Acidobacteriaceae bacterium]